jgi:hypothetical protein
MAKRTNIPAGGLGSRNVKEVPVRTGKPAYGANPAAVSQWGEAIGNKVTAEVGGKIGYRGEAMRNGLTPAGGRVPLGNEVSAKTVCGPGGSRTVRAAGSQGTQGPVNPGQSRPGADKPVFPGFK